MNEQQLKELMDKWHDYELEFYESDYMDIDKHTSMAHKVPKLIGEIRNLRNVLEFYADKQNYRANSFVDLTPEINKDNGEKARDVLK